MSPFSSVSHSLKISWADFVIVCVSPPGLAGGARSLGGLARTGAESSCASEEKFLPIIQQKSAETHTTKIRGDFPLKVTLPAMFRAQQVPVAQLDLKVLTLEAMKAVFRCSTLERYLHMQHL